jgi:hypothetical protein
MIDKQEHEPETPEYTRHAYGSNEIRLTGRQWIVAGLFIVPMLIVPPLIWDRIEPFEPAADYRLPRGQNNDYWLFRRWSERAAGRGDVLIVGDSVIWGDTVAIDRTLPAQLNAVAAEAGGGARFANLGVLGGYPAALPNLLEHYGRAIRGRRVLLHCNLRWMLNRKTDLQVAAEDAELNHPWLLPQLTDEVAALRDRKPYQRADVVIGRHVPFVNWSRHLHQAYFDGDVLNWTLEHPYENPFARITLELPRPQTGGRREASPASGPVRRIPYKWIDLQTSFQWRQFRRTAQILRDRGNRLLVLVGPLNEHMPTADSLERYQRMVEHACRWLTEQGIAHVAPPPLPAAQYDDLNHPTAEGYRALAERLWADPQFRAVLLDAAE